jgi:hypothetical protein
MNALRRTALVTLGALLISITPANAATIAGTKCTKVGATKTVSGKKYTCVKSGKKLVWSVAVSTTPTTSVAIQKQLAARMANIIAVQMLADKLYTNSQGLNVAAPTAKTQKGKDIAAKIASAKLARQMIMSFSPMFDNFDLNDLPKETITAANKDIAPAHGVFHLAQDFYARTAGGYDAKLMPSWYKEGAAAMFGTMVAAEANKKTTNYATLAATNTADFSKATCQATYEKWRIDNTPDATPNACAQGLGQIMAEALINRTDALDKILLVEQMLGIGNSFDEAFLFAFGGTKADFFIEIDSLLKSLNW